MKTTKPLLFIFAIGITAVFAFSCTHDSAHSATDGGSFKSLKNSANNDDTTSTLNVAADTAIHTKP